MPQLLQDRVAIVTGGGTGTGAAVARCLADHGAAVVVTGRRVDKLTEVVNNVRAAGGRAVALAGDVADLEQVERTRRVALEEFGTIDILVNNAASQPHYRLTHEIPLEEFDRGFAVNVRGAFLMIRAVVPHMLERGGAIVNIASIAGLVGFKYGLSYAASKAGLIHMTRVVALDYADRGIRVNCICPGSIADGDMRATLNDLDLERVHEASTGTPANRQATTAELAELVLYLVGPSAQSMTGSVIPIDGGYTAR